MHWIIFESNMNLIFFGQCVLKVSVRELAQLKHSRHAHACGTYHLGDIQVHETWSFKSTVDCKYLKLAFPF